MPFLSRSIIQVDLWPSSGSGTSDNVTFTVIAQHTVVGVTGISQVNSEHNALQWSPWAFNQTLLAVHTDVALCAGRGHAGPGTATALNRNTY